MDVDNDEKMTGEKRRERPHKYAGSRLSRRTLLYKYGELVGLYPRCSNRSPRAAENANTEILFIDDIELDMTSRIPEQCLPLVDGGKISLCSRSFPCAIL